MRLPVYADALNQGEITKTIATKTNNNHFFRSGYLAYLTDTHRSKV